MFAIEFMGDQYDGYKVPCCTRPIHLPANVVCLVGEDVFRLLDGKGHRPGESITSVADYHLEVGGGAFQDRFAGAISVKQLTRFMRATSN